ncbi:glycoside hydrolase family 66 protein [Streptomyces sp.]|uniref:glycoside hydrolase family 66 protein n=1 Tax=Streptomyces sp. TaxID=1931 RepID=UPI002F427034
MQRRIRRSRTRIHRRTAAVLTAALIGGFLAAAPAAHAAGGTVNLTDAYVDKARYAPGTSATVSAVLKETTGAGSWSGNVTYTMTHHGATVATGSVPANVPSSGTSTVTFNVTPPATDFSGYLVQISAGSSTAATAVDVSSNWTHFPRPGYLTSYPTGTTQAAADADVATLVRRYHINNLQFYDWMWRHENPVKHNTDGSLPATWNSWNGDVISTDAVKKYITAAHNKSVSAMPYSMSYAALAGYGTESPGVSSAWGLNYASNGSPWAFQMHNGYPDTTLYQMNPANTSWQNWITDKYADQVNSMGFDGTHLDQLGNWGAMTDTSGNPVDLQAGLSSLVTATKSKLSTTPGKIVGFNAVDGFGGPDVAAAKQSDYLYSELWENHETYNSVKTYLDSQQQASGFTKPSVIAAYPNYRDDAGPLYEAESATFGGGVAFDNDHPGYTGTGFADNFGQTGDSLTFTITVPETRRYSLVWRYANATGADASRTVTLDGSTLGKVTMPFDPGHSWNNWHFDSDIVTPVLSPGTHTVTVSVGATDTGYINLDSLVLGTFDTTSVQLQNASIAASGATHIEMGQGDSMLAAPYFPDHAKQMPNALHAWMKDYYDFITAYENLLYGPDVHSVDSGSQFVKITGVTTSGDASGGTVWANVKKTANNDVIHLINLLGNDGDWRPAGKSTPPVQSNLPVKYYLGPDENPTAVRVASPDTAHGVSTSLAYTVGTDAAGRYISFTVPSLVNWDMVYIDRGFSTPAGNRYEAESAVLTNVGTNTDHPGYTGTGFADNFHLANSGVSFTVKAATAGNHNLTLRYANGGSDATRIISVDGNQIATPTFPGQGTWDTWTTLNVPVTLTAGLHTVVVWTNGNAGAINLDNLTLGSG